jgi:hypothetical protein
MDVFDLIFSLSSFIEIRVFLSLLPLVDEKMMKRKKVPKLI